jgi:hypothetical protein
VYENTQLKKDGSKSQGNLIFLNEELGKLWLHPQLSVLCHIKGKVSVKTGISSFRRVEFTDHGDLLSEGH